jgi:hypothetical protein
MIADIPAPSPLRLHKHTDLRAHGFGPLSHLPRPVDFPFASNWRLYGIYPVKPYSDRPLLSNRAVTSLVTKLTELFWLFYEDSRFNDWTVETLVENKRLTTRSEFEHRQSRTERQRPAILNNTTLGLLATSDIYVGPSLHGNVGTLVTSDIWRAQPDASSSGG